MKNLLLIPILGLALCAISCRTLTPLDPMTMEPSKHCLPHYHYGPPIHATK